MKIIEKSIVKQKKSVKILIFFATIFLLFLILALIINPKKYINSCYSGLLTWATCVLPSLLPFFIITKILTELKSLDKFFAKTKCITNFLFKAPSVSGYIFCMSIISGYPVGAKLIEEFYSKNLISTKDANKLTTFCSTSGPLFIIGTVGSIMFNNVKVGYVLFLAHILSAILNGILYRKFYVGNKNEITQKTDKTDYSSILSSSMSSSIMSVMIVGGFIAIFYMIIDILNGFNILPQFANMIEYVFNVFGIKNCGSAISNGIIEVTRGCLDLSKLNLNIKTVCVLTSGLIAFGGFSIHFQALSFLTKCKINVKFYFLQKITQTIFACVTSYILSLMFF